MAEYNPSKIIKDGNTYNFRDTTKIPLAGSNAISGSLIPSTDGTVNLGGVSYQWNQAYIKSLTINGVACGDILTHNASEFVDVSSDQTIGGNKTFTSHIGISKGSGDVELAIKNTSLSLKANTNSGMDDIRFIDKDNLIVGGLRQSFTNSKVIGMVYSRSYSSDGNSYTQVEFNLITDNQNGIGDAYVKCNNFYPNQNATINLGTSANKWKTFNGVNPGALSLPGGTVGMNLIGDVSVVGTEKKLSKDITVTGYIYIDVSFTSSNRLNLYNDTKKYGIWIPCDSGRIRQIMPISADDRLEFNVLDAGSTVNAIQLFSCQGNV